MHFDCFKIIELQRIPFIKRTLVVVLVVNFIHQRDGK